MPPRDFIFSMARGDACFMVMLSFFVGVPVPKSFVYPAFVKSRVYSPFFSVMNSFPFQCLSCVSSWIMFIARTCCGTFEVNPYLPK